MKTPPPPLSWTLLWVLLGAGTWPLLLLVAQALTMLAPVAILLVPPVGAVLQGLLMRPYLGRSWPWMIATTLGGWLGVVVTSIGLINEFVGAPVVPVLMGGAAFGLVQRFLLRRFGPRAFWNAAASALTALPAATFLAAPQRVLLLPLVALASLGAAAGLIRGAVLWFILRPDEDAERPGTALAVR